MLLAYELRNAYFLGNTRTSRIAVMFNEMNLKNKKLMYVLEKASEGLEMNFLFVANTYDVL